MSTCLQTILSEVSQKMSVVPVIMSRVSDKSKLQFLPSIGFILNQLHAAVANINNSNNYNNNVNNNFTWDNSHDYPVYDECDDFLDIDRILHGEECIQEPSEGAGCIQEPLKGAGRCQEPPEEAGRCQEPPEGAGRCQEPPEGAGRCQEPPEGAGCCQEPPEAGFCVQEPPDPRPVIKWTNVSQFKIRDVPKPSLYPVHGCSDDPVIYARRWYKGSIPFGSIPGYLTDMGVVRVPSKGFYGFKWTEIGDTWGWVLSTTQDTFQNRGGGKDRKGDGRGRGRKKRRK